MADCRDDRHRALDDRLGNFPFVEGGEVFRGAAATGDDDRVDAEARVIAGEGAQRAHDFAGSRFALHPHGDDRHGDGRAAFGHGAEHILQGSPRAAGDDRDPAGEGREPALAVLGKPAEFAEFVAELAEAELLCALADGF